MEKQHKKVLEPSTNTHVLKTDKKVKSKKFNATTEILEIEGDGVVTHGEHGPVKTESKDVIKSVQQETNPVSKKMQAVFD